MALPTGTRIGGYAVTARLGAGGMGEVYRARDTKLDREVALKILPPEFAKDADRVARFRREAKTLAAINHPHIAHIHGLDEGADGTLALVMELVEGEDLAERLRRGSIPVDEALPIARQIAEALEAAHEQGIVHRDLKPANIKVRPDGTVKVLDFGLAKAMDRLADAETSAHQTITSPALTMRGVILGTAAYMAPEQARGKPVDRRADIWAFGCVLYEMLTATRTFDGEDTTDILGAIVKTEPDWTRLPASTPPQIVALLRRCLQKDARKRLQHIGDARIEIDEAMTAPVAPVKSRGPRAIIPWSIAAVMTIVAVLFATMGWRSAPVVVVPEPPRYVELVLPDGVEMTRQLAKLAAISPDGQQVAVVGIRQGVRQVHLRSGQEGDFRALEGTTGAVSCAFAPDGASLAVLRNTGRLVIVSLTGGLVSNVTSDLDILSGFGWLDQNRIVFARQGALWSVTTDGGSPTSLTTLNRERGEAAHTNPVALPGGRGVLFSMIGIDRRIHVEALDIESGQRTRLLEDATVAEYSASGHVLLLKEGQLVAAPFDAARRVLTGPIVRVPRNVVGSNSDTPPMLSRTGVLLSTIAERAQGRLFWLSRTGEERSLQLPPRDYLAVRLSPDGRRLAFSAADDGIWTYELDRGTLQRTAGGAGVLATFPSWMPDSRELIGLMSNGVHRFAANTNATTHLKGSALGDLPASVTPDGKFVGVTRLRGASAALFMVPLDGSDAKQLIDGPAFHAGPAFSPDGHWFAYVSDESDRPEIFVRSMTDARQKFVVSTNGGAQPLWRRDGKELFFREGDKLMAASMSLGREPRIGQPAVLFERRFAFGSSVGIAMFDVSNDGKQFLVVKNEGGRDYLRLVLNFHDLLNQIAPVK